MNTSPARENSGLKQVNASLHPEPLIINEVMISQWLWERRAEQAYLVVIKII